MRVANLDASAPPQSCVRSDRLGALDALRGVAILLVVMGHYLPGRLVTGWGEAILKPFAVGGVILFFLLSGFLIERNLNRNADAVVYGLRRAFRLLPAYWVAIPVLLLVHRGLLGDTSFSAPRDVLANLLLISDVMRAPLISAVFWTLLIEVKFYLLAPFIVRLGRPAVLAAPYALMALNGAVVARRGEASALLTYITFCFAGMSFSLWLRREASDAMLLVLTIACALSIALFSPYFKLGLAVFAVFSAAALAFALRHDLTAPPLAFVGAVSYSWYLYHASIGYPLMDALHGSSAGLPAMVAVVAAALITLTLAWISYRWIERPGIELGRRFEPGALR